MATLLTFYQESISSISMMVSTKVIEKTVSKEDLLDLKYY